jgi:hypothetical protein
LLASSLKVTQPSSTAAVGAGAALSRRRCGSAFLRPSNRVCTFHVGKPEAIVCSQLRQGLPTKSQGQDGETIATSCGHSTSTTCLAGKGLDSYHRTSTERRCVPPPPPRQRASSPVQAVVPDRVKVRSSVRIFYLQTSSSRDVGNYIKLGGQVVMWGTQSASSS